MATAFDPDAYLANKKPAFDPDEYLRTKQTPAFDPDKYLQSKAAEPVAEPAPMPTATTTEVGGVDVTGFGSTMEMATEKPTEQPKIAFKDLAAQPELFNKVENYMKAVGRDAYKPGEDREEYVKKFLSERRFNDVNFTFGMVPELNRLKNATPEIKRSIAEGVDLYEKTAGAYSGEGQGGLSPVWDVLKAVGADVPLYLITGGAGKVAGGATASALVKGATAKTLSRAGVAGIGTAEALTGASADITQQRTKQEVVKAFGEVPEPLDLKQTAAVALFSGAIGAGVPLIGSKMSPAKVKAQGQELAEAIAEAQKKNTPIVPANPNAPPTRVEKALADPLRDNMDAVHTEYMKIYGKDLLNTIDPQNELTDAKVRTEYSKAAVRVAMKVIEIDPAFQLKPNEQVSAAINKVFANLKQVDDVALESALTSVGVDKRQFAAMMQASVSDAARQMQQYSAAARLLKNMMSKDAEFEKKIKDLYSFEADQTGAFSRINQAQQRLAREWKAIITSGVDTTARNTLSTALVLPLKSGVQFMEGTLYAFGSALSKGAKGQRGEVFTRAMSDTIHDAFDVYFYMKNKGLTTEAADAILGSNQTLRNSILTGLQETGDREVSALAKWANSLNVAIDGFSRRAVFVASVERQLRRQGKDLYKDFLGKDLGIPTDILKEATKDAQTITFSYLPKAEDRTIASSFERFWSGVGGDFIRRVDKTPFINFLIPFPRYMTNSMAYLYRYSPLGTIGATQDVSIAYKLAKEGKTEQAEKLFRQGSEKFIQSAIGMSALFAAYEYRKENLDTPWYEAKTNRGTTVDIRPFGTPSNYYAIADIMARYEQGRIKGDEVKAAIESITGLKTKAGSGDVFLDRILNVFQSEEKFREFSIEMGKFVGDIAGGFTQPFVVKQLVDFANAVREEGNVIRDPNVIEAETPLTAAGEAAAKRVMGRLPVAKEELPEAVLRLSEGERTREGEYFNRLVGFRQLIQRNPVEQEVAKLNLDPYALYGSSSGDRKYDRDFIKNANPIVLEQARAKMQSRQYQELPDTEKAIALKDVISDAVSIAREKTNSEYAAQDLLKVYKMKYNKLPKDIKTAINRRYKEDNDGRSIEEDKAYFQIDKYETELKARTGTLQGDTASQSRQLFGR